MPGRNSVNVPGGLERMTRRRSGPGADLQHRQAGAARGRGDRRHEIALGPGHPPQFVVRVRVVGVAGVAQDAEQAQAGQRIDGAKEGDGVGRVGGDATAVEADVHLDQHLRQLARRGHRLRPPPRHRQVVDDERDPCALLQCQHARGLIGLERIGQPDVAGTGSDEHLGFAELGAADADRAGLDLSARRSGSCGSWRAGAGSRRRRWRPPACARCWRRAAGARRARPASADRPGSRDQ